MGIKNIHIIFITFAALLTAGFGVWAYQYSQWADKAGYVPAAAVSGLCTVALVVYAIKVYRKLNSLS